MNKEYNNIETNYFFVNRTLLNSDRWLSEPFTRGQAWVDLFGLAQHTPGFFRVRGIKVEVDRGQLAYSQQTLGIRWKWSRGKVKRYLVELEKNGDIVQQNNTVTTLITIVKYNKWQANGTPYEHQTVQQTDIKRYTYKNDKNVKNDKKEIPQSHPLGASSVSSVYNKDIQREILIAFCELKGWTLDKTTQKVVYSRHSKPMKELFLILGDEQSVKKVLKTAKSHFENKGLDWTVETVIKWLPELLKTNKRTIGGRIC